MANPIEAMREAIATALGSPGAIDAVVRCEIADLDKVARAAWKLALDTLDGPSFRGLHDDANLNFLAAARAEILTG